MAFVLLCDYPIIADRCFYQIFHCGCMSKGNRILPQCLYLWSSLLSRRGLSQIYPPPPQRANIKIQKVINAALVVILFTIRYLLIGKDLTVLVMREINLLFLTFCIFRIVTICIQSRDNLFSRMGRCYSLYIYIFHLLVMGICEMFATKLPAHVSDSYMYINPICVFLLSIAITSVLGKFKILRVE